MSRTSTNPLRAEPRRRNFKDRPRRRRKPYKLNLEVLETRQLLSRGGGPLATLQVMERLDAHSHGAIASHYDHLIQVWAVRHEPLLERLWAHHPRWAEAVGLPSVPATSIPPAPANNKPPAMSTTPLSPGSSTPIVSSPQPPSSVVPLTAGSPPVANNDSYTVYHDRALIATTSQSGVLANDTDPNGYSLTAILVTGVQHGTLTLNANGTLIYMPGSGYSGTDSFTYKDYDGVYYSGTATVTITVQESAPVANTMSFTIGHDRTLTGAVSTSDAEGDALSATVVSTTTHGTIVLNANGTFTYTPTAHYYGSDSFTFHASDGLLTSNTATVSLTVAETAPVAGNDYFTTGVNQPLDSTSTTSFGVQAFDTDAEGDALMSQVVTGPQHGTLTFNSNGAFLYTPNTGYSGLDTFTYTDSDGILTSNTATVYIYVGTQTTIQYYTTAQQPAAAEGSPTSSTYPFLLFNYTAGSISDYSAMVQWGDGTETPGIVATGRDGMGPSISGSHTYTKAGSYPVTIVILGDSTAQYAMDIFSHYITATISDQALRGTSLSFSAFTNQANSLEVASFTDADPGAKASDYTATINWGNGMTSSGTVALDPAGGKFDVFGTDPYTAAGTETVGVTIRDFGSSTTSINSTATVTANPFIASNVSPSATEGAAFSGIVATFTDTKPGSAASIVSVPISWGDGATSTGSVIADPNIAGQYDVIGTHTYAEEGSFTVAVKLGDQFGA